ncbi:MAG: FkbM family methyltransferase [Vicinamibacterales bacterium]
MPIAIGGNVIHIDLRDALSHELLKGSPWAAPPWEQDEQAVMRQVIRPRDVAIDIGGHFGMHTALMAQLVGVQGVVHVFEINPRRHDALAYTAAASAGRVVLHGVGLSDTEENVTLFVPAEDESMASLRDWTDGRVGGIDQVRCKVKTLDAMIAGEGLPLPDFIKCDVEGAERRVFVGARAVLNRMDAPFIMYEANALSARAFGDSVSSATEWLASLDAPRYRFFHVQPQGTLVPIEPHLHTRDDNFNLLAVPSGRNRLRAAPGM